MSRRKGREQAFIFLFQNSFTKENIDGIIESAKMAEDIEVDDFAVVLFDGVIKNREKIRSYIEKNIKGWKIHRISRVAMAIMEISTYEMLYEESVPVEISINEAVELAKKYGGKEESSYVNGVLGAINKEILQERQAENAKKID